MTRPANDKMFDHHHTYSREHGYQSVPYEHQEYPKVVGKDADGKDVIAQNADEEQEFLKAKPE